MVLTLLLLVGCTESISIQVDTPPCEDYDFANPPEDGIEVSQEGDDWHVYRVGVFQGCDDLFDPIIEGERNVISVYEYWNERTEDYCFACFYPTIVIEQPKEGVYEVGWYESGGATTIDVVSFEVE